MEAGAVSGLPWSHSLAPFAPANYSMNYNPQNTGSFWLWAQGMNVPENRTNPGQPAGHHIYSK